MSDMIIIGTLIILIAAVVLFFTNAHKFTFIILSRPATILLMIFMWLSFPEYDRQWIDSYEDREGYHDVYETTFNDEPSKFEKLFDDNTNVAYFIFNTLIFVFIFYLFVVTRKAFKLVSIAKIEIDLVGMLSFAALFLFNPIDPLIRYLPSTWMLSIKTFYLICLGLWGVYYQKAKRLYKLNGEVSIEKSRTQ